MYAIPFLLLNISVAAHLWGFLSPLKERWDIWRLNSGSQEWLGLGVMVLI